MMYIQEVYTIKKEINKLKQQAIKSVAQKMGKEYEFLTQYEWDLPIEA